MLKISILEYAPQNTLLIGATEKSRKLLKDIRKNPHLLYNVIGFVTKDGSVNFHVKGYDVGGVKSVVVRAQNGTITPGQYIGIFQVGLDVSTEGDTDVFVLSNDTAYANTPLEHSLTISPKTDNPEVIVSVEVLDMGGISGRSNSTTAPDVTIAFSTQ